MRQRVSGILAFVLLVPFSLLATSSSHSGHSSSTRSSTKSSAGKTEHVNGYYRKDGTYVAPYDRHPAGTAPHEGGEASSSSYSSHAAGTFSYIPHSYTPYKKDHITSGYKPHPSVQYDNHGKIKRSETAKNKFKREHPCPSNGHTSGSCPGYVIDHVQPLECGGADAPSNMQWQTVAEGKAKDKTERYCR